MKDTRSRSTLLTTLSLCGLLIGLLGLIGFLGGLVVSMAGKGVLTRYQLPLGDAAGLAVDRQGRIYVGSRAYYRIQRYSPTGKFQRAWHAPIKMTKGNFCIDAQDRLVLGSKAPAYRLDDTGWDRASDLGRLRCQTEVTGFFTGPDNALYSLAGPPIHVTKRAPDGKVTRVVELPLYLWLLQSPLPAWILLFLGFVIFGVADEARKRLEQ